MLGCAEQFLYWRSEMQIKTQEELDIMQYANDLASAAHVKVGSCASLPCPVVHANLALQSLAV
jgi:hypothetical protein